MLGLGYFNQRPSTDWAKGSGPFNTRIGSFDCFDSKHTAILDGDRLADIKAADLFGDVPAEFDVRKFASVWPAVGQYSFFCDQFSSVVSSRNDVHTLAMKRLHDCAEQRVIRCVFTSREEGWDKGSDAFGIWCVG